MEINGIVYLYNAKSMLLIELGDKKELYYKNSGQIKKSVLVKLEKNLIIEKGGFTRITLDESELSEFVDKQLNSYIPRKFTIEVTENCNLRCKYCLFAKIDNINYRIHGNNNINIDVTKKAIDFYFHRYTSMLMSIPKEKRQKLINICPPKISWWGGEPFLSFDIIKISKEYFCTRSWHKFGIKQSDLVFVVVSNLTILNSEIEQFLVSNNVLLHVSIDGGEKEHNSNRVFFNEKGTFDLVIKNLRYLIDRYPDYAKKRIITQAVWADNINIMNSYAFMYKEFKINTAEKQIVNFLIYNQKKEKQILSDRQIIVDEEQQLYQF